MCTRTLASRDVFCSTDIRHRRSLEYTSKRFNLSCDQSDVPGVSGMACRRENNTTKLNGAVAFTLGVHPGLCTVSKIVILLSFKHWNFGDEIVSGNHCILPH